ncbi:hypothetical protein [Yoonia sp. SS1-5]|uniref:Uncharacterized protein n=1 Tax=Yoonia rhodophyticola TaxID=3137370 RepID=A0AAN0MK86_9RHOB
MGSAFMTRGVPVFLVAAGFSLVMGIDFHERRENHDTSEGTLTFSRYLAAVPARIAAALQPTARPAQIAELMPQKVPGWDTRPMTDADYNTLTQIPRDPLADEQAALIEELQTNVSFQIMKAQQMAGIKQEALTYQRDDKMVILKVTYRPTEFFEQPGGEELAMMQDLLRDAAAVETTPFGTVQGLDFEMLDIPNSVGARQIFGRMGRQMDIELVTNTNDRTTMLVLNRLNIAGLNGILDAPLPEIDSQLASVLAAKVRGTPRVQDAPVKTGPVVRRGGSGQGTAAQNQNGCRTEGAIRRCTVGNE